MQSEAPRGSEQGRARGPRSALPPATKSEALGFLVTRPASSQPQRPAGEQDTGSGTCGLLREDRRARDHERQVSLDSASPASSVQRPCCQERHAGLLLRSRPCSPLGPADLEGAESTSQLPKEDMTSPSPHPGQTHGVGGQPSRVICRRPSCGNSAGITGKEALLFGALMTLEGGSWGLLGAGWCCVGGSLENSVTWMTAELRDGPRRGPAGV